MLTTLLLSFLIDLTAGDPPNRFHPVAWMGTLIGRLQKVAPTEGDAIPFTAGAGIALGGGLLVWTAGRLIQQLSHWLPWPVAVLIEAAILKSTFSLGGLIKAGREVEAALLQNDLQEARRIVSWHLVSRDTSQLDTSQVSAATIESLAENLSDGVIAPILFYGLGGLPAALTYRYLNTCDSMLGYRDAEREWLGKFPARLDDLLNLAPARLTAAGILTVGLPISNDIQQTIAVYQRDCRETKSPNAGHPMSAMAGVLGVELEKVGQYRLGYGNRLPIISDIQKSARVIIRATIVCCGAILILNKLLGKRKSRSNAQPN